MEEHQEEEQPQLTLEEELRTAQETRRSLEALIESPGWKYILNIQGSNLAILDKELRGASGGLDGMVVKEYTTGERAGIMSVLGTPDLMLSGLSDTIEALIEDRREGRENEETE